MNNFDAAFRAKNKAASDFRARLNAGGARVVGDGPRYPLPPVGIFNADGTPHPMNDFRARAAQVAPPVIEPVVEPSVKPTPPNSGPQPLAPPNSGPRQPVPPNSGPQRPVPPNSGPQPLAPPNSGPQRPSAFTRAASAAVNAIHGGETVGEAATRWGKGALDAGKSVANSLPGRGVTALAKGSMRAAPWFAAASDAASLADVVTDPKKTKLDVGAELAGDAGRWASAGLFAKGGATLGAMTGPVAPAAVPVLGLAGGALGYFGADKLMKAFGGERPSDTSNGVVNQMLAGTPLGRAAKPDGITQAAPVVGKDGVPVAQPAALSADLQRVKDTTFDPNNNPFIRRASPEAELARQQANFASTADGGNGLGAAVDAAFHAQRGKFSDGAKAFADDGTRALFNANQALQGTGIQANKQANGVTEFSGNNVSGMGGKLYRAADGSITNDWSKTKDYADQIQRNAKDQDRLAELTRGAAMSGDKEAVARLTAGDGRLQAIAEKAATERDLRQAVKDGSAKAAQVLATMENTGADNAYKAQDLSLRRAAMVGAQEDRDLDRALRRDALAEKVATANRTAMKDAREVTQSRMTALDKQLEQYATVDGKLDGQRLGRLRGLAANLKPGEGQSPEEFNKDVTTLVSLASKLDDGQAWYDKLVSQAGLGGTDLRKWKANPNRWRGGFTTDQGDHISVSQYNKLTDDEKAFFKSKFLQGSE